MIELSTRMKHLPTLRTVCVCLIALLLFFVAAACVEVSNPSADNGQVLVYIGTYTGPKSQGIYAYRLDRASGAMTSLGLAAETVNPSFLAIHPNHRYLYTVSEVDSFGGKKVGAVSAFAIDPRTGKLT
ncbi:MAG: hypothetical protein DMG06_02195, partial [Acidobacteria bacterium]